jgi:hypothetical protein
MLETAGDKLGSRSSKKIKLELLQLAKAKSAKLMCPELGSGPGSRPVSQARSLLKTLLQQFRTHPLLMLRTQSTRRIQQQAKVLGPNGVHQQQLRPQKDPSHRRRKSPREALVHP